MELTDGLAGGGITAAIVALIFAVKKLMERSSCHSDTSCCQLDIAAVVEEQVRQRTERDQQDLVELVLQRLQQDEISDAKCEYEDNTV